MGSCKRPGARVLRIQRKTQPVSSEIEPQDCVNAFETGIRSSIVELEALSAELNGSTITALTPASMVKCIQIASKLIVVVSDIVGMSNSLQVAQEAQPATATSTPAAVEGPAVNPDAPVAESSPEVPSTETDESCVDDASNSG